MVGLILHISESWLHGAIDNNLITHNGYTLIRFGRVKKAGGKIKRGGGLCAYDRKGIEVTFDSKSNFHYSDVDLELMYFRISAANQKPVDIFLINRPPSGKCNKCG